MILDKLLMFSEAQAVTASAASTDVIDLSPIDGTRRDIGVGYPLEFWATVNTTATAAGAATLNFQLQTSPDNSTWTTLYDSGTLALAALTAGKRLFSAKVPAGVQRYLRVNYVVGTGPLTAGAFTSGINLDVDNNTPYYPTRSKVTG
ncbi:Bbp16 family capsid cement protein [Enterobacter kobei]